MPSTPSILNFAKVVKIIERAKKPMLSTPN